MLFRSKYTARTNPKQRETTGAQALAERPSKKTEKIKKTKAKLPQPSSPTIAGVHRPRTRRNTIAQFGFRSHIGGPHNTEPMRRLWHIDRGHTPCFSHPESGTPDSPPPGHHPELGAPPLPHHGRRCPPPENHQIEAVVTSSRLHDGISENSHRNWRCKIGRAHV